MASGHLGPSPEGVEPEPTGTPGKGRDFSTPVIVGVLGTAQVLIIYVLLVVETPLSPLVRRAAETALGKVVLGLVGFVVISVFMIIGLSLLERHQRRSRPAEPGSSESREENQ